MASREQEEERAQQEENEFGYGSPNNETGSYPSISNIHMLELLRVGLYE